MKLSEEDTELFYKLHPALLFYTNQQKGIAKDVTTIEDFMELPIEEKIKIREILYNHPKLIDSFVRENPFNFSQEELEIVKSGKNFIKDEFYLFRYLKKYAIFLDDNSPQKAYGVLALKSDFQDIARPWLPVFLKAVLLPFKGQIIYDGVLIPYPVSFGPGIRHDLKEAYQDARTFGRRLSKIGLRGAWFAILEGEIVAGGSTRAEVEQILDGIIPKEKRNFVYVFRLRGK